MMKHYWWVLPMIMLLTVLFVSLPFWLYGVTAFLIFLLIVLITDSVAKGKGDL